MTAKNTDKVPVCIAVMQAFEEARYEDYKTIVRSLEAALNASPELTALIAENEQLTLDNKRVQELESRIEKLHLEMNSKIVERDARIYELTTKLAKRQWRSMDDAPRHGRILVRDGDLGPVVVSAGWTIGKEDEIRWEAINESPLWREVLHLRAEVNELTEKCKELALDASACEVMCDQARSQRDRAIAACERQAASHESTVAMLRAGQERTRLILREGLHACLGPRCLCKTGDCAKSDACPYGRTTAKETTK